MQRVVHIILVLLLGGACLIPVDRARARPFPANTPRPKVVIAAVGDLLFDRGVRDEIDRSGAERLLSGVADTLRAADLAVGNLECPLSRRGMRSAKPYSFRGDPEMAAVLAAAGFDVLSLANNHSLDYGRSALNDTSRAIEAAGMTPVGAGANRSSALAGTVVEKNGLKVGFAAYCDLFVEGTTPRDDAPGIATGDDEGFLHAITELNKRSDVVVVLVHWGAEYQTRATTRQKELGRRMIDAGASLILGAHPHVLQPVERGQATAIAYSLGNFVFDQRRPPSSESAILLVEITPEGVESVDFVPVVIEACRPSPVLGDTAEVIARRLGLPLQ